MIIQNFMPEIGERSVQERILTCLRAEPKALPSVFFYDQKGSELFEQITKLEEYYLPDVEIPLLSSTAKKVNSELKECNLVELGSGDCSKISVFLDAVPKDIRETIIYYPVDVSKDAMEKSGHILQNKFPEIGIHGINSDFIEGMDKIPGDKNRFFCFFGSTIGNLTPARTNEFMERLGNVMDKNDRLLLGVDMVKDINVLERAYNDNLGITAEFNKNILRVANDHIGTDFDPDDFEHVAFFNKELSRIEMHLKVKRDLVVKSDLFEERFIFKKGETIHTENSQKYTVQHIYDMANTAGLFVSDIFSDEKNWFSLAEMVKK